jgi:hypothetical protein
MFVTSCDSCARDAPLSVAHVPQVLSLHHLVVCRSRSKSPRRHKRSRSRSRERGSSKGRSSSRPNLLQMSYDEYLAHFERIRRQRASGRPDSSQVCTGPRHVSGLHTGWLHTGDLDSRSDDACGVCH